MRGAPLHDPPARAAAKVHSRETHVLANRFTRTLAIAASVLALPGALAAQANRPMTARPPTPSATAEANMRAWATELRQISARLQAAHNRVMQQNPQIRTAQEAFMRDVKAAMQRQDPGLDALARRVEQMQAEGTAAQQRGDRARVQQLQTELLRIQQRFAQAQQQVMQQPAIKQRAQQIEQQLHAAMLRAEPETDRLMARGKELNDRLMRARQQRRQQPRQE